MKSNRAFTLVELIVVIAIVAILAAVSIVGFTRYIDNARWSNDQSAAAQMNDIIEYYMIEKSDITLDAHDVRTIINENHGDDFDFTPQTRDAGFFYISGSIVVAKFEDIGDPSYELSTDPLNRLLSNDHFLDASTDIGNTPEELFGEGRFLLSTEGNIVSEIISKLRNLGSSSTFEADFDELETRVSTMGDGIFGDDTHKVRLQEVLSAFDPEHTLFVNDTDWRYQETESDHIGWYADRVIMISGIANIPTYTGPRTTILEDITIPRSVRTIETDAFASFRNHPSRTLDIIMPSDTRIMVQQNAFSSAQMSSLDAPLTITFNWSVPELDIAVYLDDVLVEEGTCIDRNAVGSESLLTFTIESINRGSITTMIGSLQGNEYTVRVYTATGLMGIKTVEFCSV